MIALIALPAPRALAQLDVRPADRRPEAETPGEPEPPPPVVVEPRRAPADPPGASGPRLVPRGFEVVGATAFDDDEVAAIFAPWVGRSVSTADLVALVEALGDLYHDAGFVTSQVVLPDQDVVDGIVRIRVIEGRVDGIEVSGAGRLRPGYLRARLERATRAPLDVPRLVRRLESLQEERVVERIEAVLEEQSPGVHRLAVRVRERTPMEVGARLSNHRSPSIGSFGGTVEVGSASLFGWSDRFAIAVQQSEGLTDIRFDASVPVTPWDTRFGVSYRNASARIVEAPFVDLEIAGEYQAVAFSLTHPLRLGGGWRASFELVGEWREASTTIFDRVFCFQANLSDCRPSAAIVRLGQEVSWRGRTHALAARSLVSIGVDALGATPQLGGTGPDGRFVSWLAQVSWAQILPEIGALPWLDGMQLLVRGDLQLASDPLLSFEQVGIGGATTVRGYRWNQVIRDNGSVASIELRIPLVRSGFDRTLVEIAPFVDYGSAWDSAPSLRSSESLTSTGLALRASPVPYLSFDMSWAHRFRDDLVEGDTSQSQGIYFQVAFDVP